jgi:hypothetical protein
MGQGACTQDGVPCQLGEPDTLSVGPQRIFRSAAGSGKTAQVVQDDGHQVIRVHVPRQAQAIVQVLRRLVEPAKGQVHITELAQDQGFQDLVTQLLSQRARRLEALQRWLIVAEPLVGVRQMRQRYALLMRLALYRLHGLLPVAGCVFKVAVVK